MPRIPDSVRRSRNAAGARHQSGPPGASEPLPLGVAGGHQLRRLDDLGTMTAGHQLLHLDDLHTSSFARTELGRRPFGESYGLPSHPSTGNSQPSMISIRALLTENALADEFVSAFHARRLPEKFFYWFPLSVRAWLALCSDGAYRNFVRSRSLIARSGAELARLFPVAPLEVVSLGAGQGDKDLLLLGALRERGARVSYVPVDTSQALLEMACAGALSAGFPAQGIKADFTNPTHLKALAAEPESPPRLVLLGGEAMRLARGERLAMNHSYKYAAETFLRILSEAGLTARWQGRSDDQRFLMVLASPA